MSAAASGTLVVEWVNHHTCGTGPDGYYGAHEPGCGSEPLFQCASELEASNAASMLNHVTAERDRARDIAVALEQENVRLEEEVAVLQRALNGEVKWTQIGDLHA